MWSRTFLIGNSYNGKFIKTLEYLISGHWNFHAPFDLHVYACTFNCKHTNGFAWKGSMHEDVFKQKEQWTDSNKFCQYRQFLRPILWNNIGHSILEQHFRTPVSLDNCLVSNQPSISSHHFTIWIFSKVIHAPLVTRCSFSNFHIK